jgi:XTP/dITP diphosphohydrolase
VRFVLASRNRHKLRELEALLRPHLLEPLPAEFELPPEVGATFAENALTKATAAALVTGELSIADDSGIEVAALDGRPGIHSARFAGDGASDEENLAKLLDEMKGATDRRAAYVCAIGLVEPGGERRLFEGRCEGRLIREPRGSGGFGYDPIFVPGDYARGPERTMAELTPGEKDAISHRGRAAGQLLAWLSARR